MRGSKGNSPKTVLVADDDEIVRRVFQEALEEAGYDVVLAPHGAEAIQLLSDDVAVAILDLNMPEATGLDCLRHIRKHRPETESIVCTGSAEVADAVQAMKTGAFDYLLKPVNLEELVELVGRAVQTVQLRRENRELRAAISSPRVSTVFVGDSPAAEKVRQVARRIGPLDSTVLITGESGVGKGLVARLIHESGPRNQEAFVTVSCTALPRDLVEAELFGHEKGAFTGAVDTRPGRLEMASGGTLFLDEIGDMPLDLQPKLLTFLQERSFHRIGSNQTIEVNVRIIAATNQELKAMCRDKKFREDLFFRLNVLPVRIPPLRERRQDIKPLSDHILRTLSQRQGSDLATVTARSIELLTRYDWPGNVRELENVLERTIAFLDRKEIRPEDLPPELNQATVRQTGDSSALAGLPLAEVEKLAIAQTLELCKGNKSQAARTLGISEKSIYNKMKRLGL